jgi:MoaA/NifB/PqqE/SkfB family radical SAM enzyme
MSSYYYLVIRQEVNMVNTYMNISRIEFSVTNSCTSHCRHCSVGDVTAKERATIDKDAAVSAVKGLSGLFNIESVMTFGGEPLLFAGTTCAIHKTAYECGIPVRQVITNGYFSNGKEKITAVAKALKASGVNSLLLSVDAFHKEFIPLGKAYLFAKALCDESLEGFKLHPAWVVNREHCNSYNKETEACLNYFADLHIPVSNGNNIFPEGNAARFLSDFYQKKPIDLNVKCGEAPYTDRLDDVRTIAINPNGDVAVCCFVIGNICRDDIVDIVKRYNPCESPVMSAVMNGGVCELIKYAGTMGIEVDASKFYSACDICRHLVKEVTKGV